MFAHLEEDTSRQDVGDLQKLEKHVTILLVTPSWEQEGQGESKPDHSITSGPRNIPWFQERYNSISE
jgi:hypothetical protein